jgi:hypothetical protein
MTATPQPDRVRQLIARTFEEFGVPIDNELELNETLLIESRRLVARSYRAGDLMAMWLIGAGLVQFYDGDGAMLRTVNLFKFVQPKRMAA